MSTSLREIAAPDLVPLRNSAEYDQLESEMKTAFINVFNTYIRDRERQLNFYGMPHLGDTELIERVLKDYGLAIVRRDATRTAFLLKAARARNPRRGMIFLRQYLQSIWPNVWKVEPLWHPIATAANYPADRTPLGTLQLDASTSAVYDPDSDDGMPVIYRDDWQGKLPMSALPRTNSLPNSRNVALWPVQAGWTRAASTDVPAPDGTTTDVTEFVAGAAPTPLFARLTQAFPVGARVSSIWIFVPTGQVSTWQLSVDYQDANTSTVFESTVSGQWVRAVMPASVSAARTWLDWNIRPNDVNPVAGFTFYVTCGQEEPGTIPTRFIATGAVPVPYTDYTVSDVGIATFTDGVTPPSAITHFLTGRIRVTLPVSIDNGLGLLEIAKAFRSTLAARLMLELQLSTVFENIGMASGGLALANGAKGVMPFTAIGKLK